MVAPQGVSKGAAAPLAYWGIFSVAEQCEKKMP